MLFISNLELIHITLGVRAAGIGPDSNWHTRVPCCR